MRRELHLNFDSPGFPVGFIPGPAFNTLVGDGAWTGKRCFIVAGGPSVKCLDLFRLRNELTIGINRALELFEPTIWFSADTRVVSWVESGSFGETACGRLRDPNLLKCVVVTSPDGYVSKLPMLRRSFDTGLTATMKDGLFTGLGLACNSGLGALNLALCLGANPIYLIGFDMKNGKDGNRTWCDDDYPVQDAADLELLIEAFTDVANIARARASVVNLNPDSALTCFEFGEIDQILP